MDEKWDPNGYWEYQRQFTRPHEDRNNSPVLACMPDLDSSGGSNDMEINSASNESSDTDVSTTASNNASVLGNFGLSNLGSSVGSIGSDMGSVSNSSSGYSSCWSGNFSGSSNDSRISWSSGYTSCMTSDSGSSNSMLAAGMEVVQAVDVLRNDLQDNPALNRVDLMNHGCHPYHDMSENSLIKESADIQLTMNIASIQMKNAFDKMTRVYISGYEPLYIHSDLQRLRNTMRHYAQEFQEQTRLVDNVLTELLNEVIYGHASNTNPPATTTNDPMPQQSIAWTEHNAHDLLSDMFVDNDPLSIDISELIENTNWDLPSVPEADEANACVICTLTGSNGCNSQSETHTDNIDKMFQD